MVEIPQFPELTFDETHHIYKLNGFAIPSVSEIMRPLSNSYYGGVDEDVLKRAASRGTSVHSAVENYLLFGIEDISSEFMGYFNGFKKWIDTHKPIPIKPECRLYHKTLRYGGTADLPCIIDNKLVLVDFKTTSSVAKILTRVQLEAYKQGFLSHGIKFERKLIVQSRQDGTYHEDEHPIDDIESWRVFKELLDVYFFIKKNK